MPTHTRKAFSPEERENYKETISTLCGIIGIVGVLELTAEIASDYAERGVKRTGFFPRKQIGQWLEISAIIDRAYDEVMSAINRA